MAHLEIIVTLIYKLMKDISVKEIKNAGAEGYYVYHGRALNYTDADGVPWTAVYIQSTGDPINN